MLTSWEVFLIINLSPPTPTPTSASPKKKARKKNDSLAAARKRLE